MNASEQGKKAQICCFHKYPYMNSWAKPNCTTSNTGHAEKIPSSQSYWRWEVQILCEPLPLLQSHKVSDVAAGHERTNQDPEKPKTTTTTKKLDCMLACKIHRSTELSSFFPRESCQPEITSHTRCKVHLILCDHAAHFSLLSPP